MAKYVLNEDIANLMAQANKYVSVSGLAKIIGVSPSVVKRVIKGPRIYWDKTHAKIRESTLNGILAKRDIIEQLGQGVPVYDIVNGSAKAHKPESPIEHRWEVHIKNGRYFVAAETLTVEGDALVFRSNGVITQAHGDWLGVFLKED